MSSRTEQAISEIKLNTTTTTTPRQSRRHLRPNKYGEDPVPDENEEEAGGGYETKEAETGARVPL
mgnify:CR=1 FL=1